MGLVPVSTGVHTSGTSIYVRGQSSLLSSCYLAQSQARAVQCGLPIKEPPLRQTVLLAAHIDISDPAAWSNTNGSVLQVQDCPQGRQNPVHHQLPGQPLPPGLLLQGEPLQLVLAMYAHCLTWAVLRTMRTMMERMSTMLGERRAAR